MGRGVRQGNNIRSVQNYMRIHSDAIHYGLNYDKGSLKDERYVRCRRCGFMCHLDRNRHSHAGSREGDGVRTDRTIIINES